MEGGFCFNRFDETLRVGDSLGTSTPMLVSPLSPATDDIGTSLRMFGQIIKPLFARAALKVAKEINGEGKILKSFV